MGTVECNKVNSKTEIRRPHELGLRATAAMATGTHVSNYKVQANEL